MKKPDQKKLKKHVYTAAQWTWGLPQTLLGAALYAKHRNDDHFEYRGAKATVWDKDAGISLGRYIFVPRRAVKSSGEGSGVSSDTGSPDQFMIEHEYGHTLQSLILGPFYLLFVGAPSIAWHRLPYFRKKRMKTGRSYYSAPFEKTANTLAAHRHHHKQDK